jgi:CHAT domain-containing protein
MHFSCHGSWDQVFPSLSAVVMGEVGEKGGSEAGYLSACETGLGKVVRGDGVGVTLRQVDDTATKEFIRSGENTDPFF